MAQPTTYQRQYSFTAFQASSPSDALPAARVDAEFNAVKQTLDEILNNIALIQRDDGEVANNTVGADQLKADVTLGFSEPTVWATATDYAVGATVFGDYVFYRCEEAHTSGTLATDVAAGKWGELADFSAVFEDASDYADAAAASASTATTKASEASVSAAAALVSQNAAAASAVTAAGYTGLYKGTSATSTTIGTGSKVFTTQAGKFFDVGAQVMIVSGANPANYMHGQVTAYSGTSLTVNVTDVGGSGTLADWTIMVAGTRGATGATGASGAGSGDLLAAQNLNDLASKATAFGNIKQAASESATGVVELATDAETQTGTDTARAITPANLAYVIGKTVQAYDADLTTLSAGGSGARDFLGLAIGTDVQAYNARLAALALGTDLPVADGGTGASTAADARANLGAAAVPTGDEFPVGYVGIMEYVGGTPNLGNGSTTAGTNVRSFVAESSGNLPGEGGRQTGTWKNISGVSLVNSGNSRRYGTMVRTA